MICIFPVLLGLSKNIYVKTGIVISLLFFPEPTTALFTVGHLVGLFLIMNFIKRSKITWGLVFYHLVSFLLWQEFFRGDNQNGLLLFFLLSFILSLCDTDELQFSNATILDKSFLAIASLTLLRFCCPLFSYWSQVGLEQAPSLNFVQAWITLLSFSFNIAFQLIAFYLIILGIYQAITSKRATMFSTKQYTSILLLFHLMLGYLLINKFSLVIGSVSIMGSIIITIAAYSNKVRWPFIVALILLYGLMLGPINIDRLFVLVQGVFNLRSIFSLYNEWFIIWSINAGWLTAVMLLLGCIVLFTYRSILRFLLGISDRLKVVCIAVLFMGNLFNIDQAPELVLLLL